MFQTVFKRYEKKYLLTEKQYFSVTEVLKDCALPDKYGKSTVCSIYYDTPDPVSFSKYGTAYKNILSKNTQSGGNHCA